MVFDLYETLITEFDPSWRPGPTPAERLGLPPLVMERVWRTRKHERMIRSVDYREVLREACTAAGLEVDEPRLRAIGELHAERLAAKSTPLLNVVPSVPETLTELRAYGLRLGLVSNCSVEEVAAWKDSPLAPLLDVTVFSYRVGHAKPDPDIYLLACRRLGVAPGGAAFVGDGGSDELGGAARAGLTPYQARWFLDRWPGWRTRRTLEDGAEFIQLASVRDLLAIADLPP